MIRRLPVKLENWKTQRRGAGMLKKEDPEKNLPQARVLYQTQVECTGGSLAAGRKYLDTVLHTWCTHGSHGQMAEALKEHNAKMYDDLEEDTDAQERRIKMCIVLRSARSLES